MRPIILIAAALLSGLVPVLGYADVHRLPQGLLFIALAGDEWRLMVVESEGAVRHVRTRSEPRTPAYAAALARVAYISAAGELREIELASGSDVAVLMPSAELSYTQPAYRPGTDELYVVALRERASIDTDIGRVDRAARRIVTVLHQRSAQFEPAFTADGSRLIYSSVACASECPRIIQEIWTMDLVSGIAGQHTLLNAVSRQPVSESSGAIVFSTNASGTYRLWRSAAAGAAQPLTGDAAIDESPVVTSTGEIYFIRRTVGGGRIMRLDERGIAQEIALDAGIRDVRDLRWGGA